MSGHSKWSTIKHQKQETDAMRGQVFTRFSNAITIAVKEGGSPDPEMNFRLRLVVDRARAANMPKENIARAIERAWGIEDEGRLKEIIYEGFAPYGVAVLIETVTDNTNRTGSEIKNIFSLHGGHLAGAGGVAYLFTRTGELRYPKMSTFDAVMQIALDAGGQDLVEDKGSFIVYTKPAELHKVKIAFERKGYVANSAELTFRPITQITPKQAETSQKILPLIQALENLAEVHKVYTNIDLSKLLSACL